MTCLWSTLAAAAAVASPGVDNPHRPAEGAAVVRLQRLWRFAGQDQVLVGGVADAARGRAGNIYLLDNHLTTVHVLAPDGTFLRDIGRSGQGPGELRFPVSLVPRPDGRIGVALPFPGMIVHLLPDGTPAGTVAVGAPGEGPYSLSSAVDRGGNLVAAIMRNESERGTWFNHLSLVRLDSTGRILTVYDERTRRIDLQPPTYVEREMYNPPWTVGPDGDVYLAPERNAYRIRVLAPDGSLLRVVKRCYRPRRRSETEMASIGSSIAIARDGRPERIEKEIEPVDQAIYALHVTGDRELWVLDGRGRHDRQEGHLGTWDVFDADGRYRRRITLDIDPPYSPDHDSLFRLDDDHWLVVRRNRDASRAYAAAMGTGQETVPEDEEDEEAGVGIELYRLPR